MENWIYAALDARWRRSLHADSSARLIEQLQAYQAQPVYHRRFELVEDILEDFCGARILAEEVRSRDTCVHVGHQRWASEQWVSGGGEVDGVAVREGDGGAAKAQRERKFSKALSGEKFSSLTRCHGCILTT